MKRGIVAVFVVLFISGVICSDWNYNDESKWPELCNTGKSQSPINLQENGVAEKDFPQFIFVNYDKNFQGTVSNNGHTVAVKLAGSNTHPKIVAGGLNTQYMLDHLHFHWGSEHTLNNHRFPLEVHLVHFSTKYGTFADALKHSDGIAVLGVFYDLSPDHDVSVEPLLKVMENVTDLPASSSQIQEINPSDFLPRDTAGFYRYNGSLTTPGCNEVVIWTVFTNTIPIAKDQVSSFEKVYSAKDVVLSKNFRGVQDVNGRHVYLKRSPLKHPEDVATRKEGNHEENKSKGDCGNSAPSNLVYSFLIQISLLAFAFVF